ncbi:MAG: glycine cleavage system aminomethyltransferase GcvT [Clostridiales Family XIII bacterium]|jgi:aminomethyltransferase|nr:glycine cleavage system aminomethyltransferase GcvT [Clostridiales Family XIII bacterium]
MMELKTTVLHEEHLRLGGTMVDFGGFDMPVNYPDGILAEHLSTRRAAGLFDISHMGRFVITGPERAEFLQHVLTNNCEALDTGEAQYTLIPDEAGGAIDDAYLYRFFEDSFLLVVNAANTEKDWAYLTERIRDFDAGIEDRTEEIGMISIQGPASKDIVASVAEDSFLTEPLRNSLGFAKLGGRDVWLAKTGYTGEPLGYEIFMPAGDAAYIWNLLREKGAKPVGLGARDTLRLEAALPLYGHELGTDRDGQEIPIYAIPMAKFAVSFAEAKGDFVGREALYRQFLAWSRIVTRHFDDLSDLPCMVRPFAMVGKGVPRAGNKVFKDGEEVGYVTSGSVAPYYRTEGKGLDTVLTDETDKRFIGLALVRSDLLPGDAIEVEIRDRRSEGAIVEWHLRGDAPPYSRAIIYGHGTDAESADSSGGYGEKAAALIRDARANHRWRQTECINLIPSEQSHSRAARILSVLDPSFRYAEHKKMKSFYDFDVFYYQGTRFIHDVELKLTEEFKKYFGCANTEIRATSGQMANTAVFSALMDWKNRANRKADAKRLGYIMNNHIIRGGHLSAQPMGALHDYIALDPKTERAALVNFPVLRENPFKIDVAETVRLIEQYRPELIVFGKSMVLHKEPVSEIRKAVDELGVETTIMYDMAHVLGLVGPYFQDPFAEGAEIVTGSTHKTFFGTQRGVIASNYKEDEAKYELWETVESRVFPGSVSNHHLGTLLGLLMAAYEMNHFKDEYQRNVIANAKAFARSLAEAGLDVAGDPDISYTETHQVIVRVGYAEGAGIAEKLEENNIIANYQATPDEEGFTASGALRLGVSEMTRFGWGKDEFARAAELIAEVILRGGNVKDEVKALRAGYTEMKYCFTDDELGGEIGRLMDTLK